MANANVVTAAGFRDAKRVNDGALARAEKRALVWMAERMPPWISSDDLSALGVGAMGFAGLCYFAAGTVSRWWLLGVVAALALNWLGDSLDGTLARVRNQQRPRYGFYLDHILDGLGTGLLLGGMALSGFITPVVALGLLAAYLLLMLEAALATYTLGVFRMSFAWFGPTELRIVLAIGSLSLLHFRTMGVWGARYLLFDVGGVIAIAGMVAAALVSALRNGRTLYREEPLR